MTTAIVLKKKTRRTRRILFILLPILLILVLGFSILFFLNHQNLIFQFRNNLAATFHKRSLPQTVSVSTYTIQLDDLLSDPNCTKNQALMLINDAYPLSDSFQPEISYYKDTDVQMNSCIQDAYAAMSAAVREQFDVPLYVREAYRTAKEQEEKTKENSAVAAEIGASEHQAGLALDLYIPQFGGWAFTKSAAGRFVDTNCRYYGFIVRYPSYGEKQTGISYEPWHLRYVSADVATYLTHNDLCLEELDLTGGETPEAPEEDVQPLDVENGEDTEPLDDGMDVLPPAPTAEPPADMPVLLDDVGPDGDQELSMFRD